MEKTMTEEQIRHMVSRFLQWKLPTSFYPDGGISFERIANPGTPHRYQREPVGTNLLTAIEAEAMVRHMLEDLPATDLGIIDPDDAEFLGEKVIEMSDRLKNMHAVVPGARATYAFEEDGVVYRLAMTIEPPADKRPTRAA